LASHPDHNELALPVDVEHARHRPAPAAAAQDRLAIGHDERALLYRQIWANSSSTRRRERLRNRGPSTTARL
jgi:hypothetical protein